MTEHKESGFLDLIRNGFDQVSKIISEGIFSQVTEGTDMVLKNIEHRLLRMEQRILRKLSSFLVIGFGCIFLVFALFFFQKEYLGWSNTAAFFFIGVTVFMIGILLKTGEYGR